MGLLTRVKNHVSRSSNTVGGSSDITADQASAPTTPNQDDAFLPNRPQDGRTCTLATVPLSRRQLTSHVSYVIRDPYLASKVSSEPTQLPAPMTNGDSGPDPKNSSKRASFFRRKAATSPSTDPATSPSFGAAETVDLTIQFIEAKGLPRTDPIGGGSDPYFKATLDGQISYNSTAQKGTMNPVWNEVWHVKNVPQSAELEVKLYDKDENVFADDYIGDFKCAVGKSGSQTLEIRGRLGMHHGNFLLNISANPVRGKSTVPPYTFAGPCRYSRHRSPTVGALTARETDERLYATWKVYMMGISEFFGDVYQPWNEKYAAAQKIFGHNPVSKTIRGTIHAGHKLLYARSTANEFGIINRAGDLIEVFKDELAGNRIKPAVYTYIINDDTWRFSETGAAFFVDFASKHALHADCHKQVRYSGEFHWRPAVPGGWGGFSDDTNDDSVTWELLIDNNSGTYAPDKKMLPAIKSLFEYNFPGIKVSAYDHDDSELKESESALRRYAKERRGITETEFTAHSKPGETTLINMANRMGLSIPRRSHESSKGSDEGSASTN